MKEELKRLGLKGYEIAIYKALLEYGVNGVKEISEYSKVPITAVYPNLKSLVNKGLIQQIKGEVSNFEAIKPSIAMRSFVEKEREEMKEIGKDIVPKLDSIMHKKEIFPTKEIVSLSHGIEASHAITRGLIAKTKKSFYVLGWRFRSSKNMYAVLNAMKKLIAKKVDVRIILTGKGIKFKNLAKYYMKARIKVRYYPLENFSLIISDSSECKITLKSLEIKERMNIHIKDKDLSKALNEYFLNIWEKGEKIKF